MELQEENGEPITKELSNTKSYRIKLVFEIQQLSPCMNFWIIFKDIYGNILFGTAPDERKLKSRIGINTLYCSIPADIFMVRNYTMALGSSIKNTRWIVNPYQDDVSIFLENTITAPQTEWKAS
jgi:hypothetical protein